MIDKKRPLFVRGSGLGRWVFLIGSGAVVLVISVVLLLVRSEQRLLQIIQELKSDHPILSMFFFIGLGLLIVGGIGLQRVLGGMLREVNTNQMNGLKKQKVLQRGPHVVAIGGGTGLPSALRALKEQTENITAVVTVADDGGSSGRLRREMGVLPPGDLRNNIVALADDENLMAQLFQFRFIEGDLKGHSFGNLFISALSSIMEGGLETALAETGRVLNIQGRVLPSTLENVNLRAQVRLKGKTRHVNVFGEAAIGEAGGFIEHLELVPKNVKGYAASVEAILRADLIIIGPGSLYTSIIPNLLVPDVASALRATSAYIVYICNVATQTGETENYTVAEHIMAIENLIGRGVFQAVLANNAYPPRPPGSKTVYVDKAPSNHQVNQRYEVFYTDLTNNDRPWRHDPKKLSKALLSLYNAEKAGKSRRDIFAD